jgi:hypothetical protein
MSRSQGFQKVRNIVIEPNAIQFSILHPPPRSTADTFYFTVARDPDFAYHPRFSDFGPLTIAHIDKFVTLLSSH